VYLNICLIFNPIQNSLKPGDALSPLLSNFGLEYVTRKAQENQVELKLNGTYHLLVAWSQLPMAGIPLPLGSRIVPSLSYQLLTATAHTD
jgi:hypothetical protein